MNFCLCLYAEFDFLKVCCRSPRDKEMSNYKLYLGHTKEKLMKPVLEFIKKKPIARHFVILFE